MIQFTRRDDWNTYIVNIVMKVLCIKKEPYDLVLFSDRAIEIMLILDKYRKEAKKNGS